MAYLITQTLIGAWNYAMSARDEVQDDAWNDFIETFHRLPRPSTPEIENGREFEDAVYLAASGAEREPHPRWESGIQKVAKILCGAPSQIRLSRPLRAAGEDLILYGVLDSMKCGTVYDVKFSNRSFASAELAGKYLESPQHPAYLYLAPEALDFVYLVSDGTDLYTERYTRRNTRNMADVAGEFIEFLRAAGLMEAYRAKWSAR